MTGEALNVCATHGIECTAANLWRERRVTVMGLGRHEGGLGAARYLAGLGARVTISDTASREQLGDSLARLADLPIAGAKLGGHDPCDFHDADCVVVNPAVHPDHPALQIARAAGTTISSEIEIFLRACPGRVIGVSGSNGKSTTATMLFEILVADGHRAWLGGNIGRSLLGELDKMTAEDWVVLELSSFQLAHLSPTAPLPAIAVLTNCTPNHLDWHRTFEAYRQAKQRLLTRRDGCAVLNAGDAEVAAWRTLAAGRAWDGWPLDALPPLRVPGEHNRQNASLAAAAAELAGVSRSAIREALGHFAGLKHRLQFVAEVDGRRFYNDSKSTTPEATIAAIDALDAPAWLLAGGRAKGADFDRLARSIRGQVRGVALFGEARGAIHERLAARSPELPTFACEGLADAFAWCWRRSQAGDAILLSPACASHDQFRDFAARGEAFCELARCVACPAESAVV
jgi:UDP-N-acetylmuramoylalanine--D-glutamate ligase